MPTAADLLDRDVSSDSAEDANRFIISEDLRTVTVPEGQEVLGVVNDSDVRRVWFTMPDECDGTPLEGFTPFVNYVNANNVTNRYEATDMVHTDGALTFSWLVNRLAFVRAGKVSFNVDLKLFDEDGQTVLKEFNTVPVEMTVLEGVASGTFNPAEVYVDEIRSALVKLVDEELDSRSVLTSSGSVPTEAALPESGVLSGAVYDVQSTGRNYVWNGSSWDDLGGLDSLTVSESSPSDIDAMFE